MGRFHRRWFAPSVLGLACAGLAACSSYSGKKIGDYLDGAGNPHHVAPDGVPYALVKPELELSLTPATTPDGQNTVTITYVGVADPYQRYAIHLDPSLLADPDFKISFTTAGTVDTTTSTVTEEVTPTIKALGSFAVSLLSIVHAAKTPGPTDLSANLSSQLGIHAGDPPCSAPWDYLDDLKGVPPPVLNPDWPVTPTIGQVLQQRVDNYKSDDELQAQFHYLTAGELACLKALPQDDKAFADALVKEVSTYPGDKGLADELKYEVHHGQVTAAPDSTLWPAASPAQIDAQKTLIQAAKDALSTPSAYIAGVVNMAPTPWRARHVAFTEAELGRVELLRVQTTRPDRTRERALDRYVDFLKEQRAQALGAADLYARSVPLERYLAKVREKMVRGGLAPASAEYVQYRGELDTLRAAIEAKRTTLLAVLTPPPPPKPPGLPTLTNEPTCWLSSRDFDPTTKPLPVTDPKNPPPSQAAQVTALCTAAPSTLQVGADGLLPPERPGALRRTFTPAPKFVIVLENP